jgi:hypothetical protein
MAMRTIPALIIDTYKDIFRAERNGARRKDPSAGSSACPTRQKTVLAALDKERDVKCSCSTEDEATGVAAGSGWRASGDRHDPARRALRLGEHGARHRHRRARAIFYMIGF